MLNVLRPLHRIFVVAACLMFVEALAVPTSAAAQSQFVCNQVIGLTLTREWYQAGFEQAPGIADDRWQLKARQSGYITEWSNPNSDFWNQAAAIAVCEWLRLSGSRRAHGVELEAAVLRHSGRVGGAGRQGRGDIAVEVCGRETHRPDDRGPRSAQPGLSVTASDRRIHRDAPGVRRGSRRRRREVPRPGVCRP